MRGDESRWGRRASVVLLAIMLLPLESTSAPAGPSCRKVHGRFTLQATSGPACPSAVLCTTVNYQGVLSGTALFIGSSLIPTVDTPITSVLLLTGDNAIHTKNGTLMTKEAIVFKTTGSGEFAEVDVIVGGTGEFAGATGALSATGTFIAPSGEGVYSGEICTP